MIKTADITKMALNEQDSRSRKLPHCVAGFIFVAQGQAPQAPPQGQAGQSIKIKDGTTDSTAGSSSNNTSLTMQIENEDLRWADHVKRHIAKFCVLIVEQGKSQSQLQQEIASVALGKVHGGESGNVILSFDANLFGESITAPHIRKPPLQQEVIKKIWNAIHGARKQPEQAGILPVGDVLIIIDGGRKSETYLNQFGMGKERKTYDKNRSQKEGKTTTREILICMDEKSVKASNASICICVFANQVLPLIVHVYMRPNPWSALEKSPHTGGPFPPGPAKVIAY